MRFWGGGVGHIRTCYLDLKLEVDNHKPGEQYDKDSDSCPQEEQGEEDENADKELEASENASDREDINKDLENKKTMNDKEILDQEEFADLWDSIAE